MAADAPLRTLIVDDEPLAVERLQILCAQREDLRVVGTAVDGAAALRLIDALKPELLLLDIAMPEMDGIGVAQALSGQVTPPAIIFCTAFDQFAVAAFEVSAVDYLLKPVASDRLGRAIERVAARLRLEETAERQQVDWATEFWVPHRSEMIRITARDIDRIEAERDYMRLHIGTRSFLLHETISALERRLDPRQFLRVHRSTIVRRDFVVRLRHDGLGAWYAGLADGTELRVGRSYLPAAKALAGR